MKKEKDNVIKILRIIIIALLFAAILLKFYLDYHN